LILVVLSQEITGLRESNKLSEVVASGLEYLDKREEFWKQQSPRLLSQRRRRPATVPTGSTRSSKSQKHDRLLTIQSARDRFLSPPKQKSRRSTSADDLIVYTEAQRDKKKAKAPAKLKKMVRESSRER